MPLKDATWRRADIWPDILLKFQWKIERDSFGLRSGPEFTSTSPPGDTRRLKKDK